MERGGLNKCSPVFFSGSLGSLSVGYSVVCSVNGKRGEGGGWGVSGF